MATVSAGELRRLLDRVNELKAELESLLRVQEDEEKAVNRSGVPAGRMSRIR